MTQGLFVMPFQAATWAKGRRKHRGFWESSGTRRRLIPRPFTGSNRFYLFIYFYAFSRHFYPKRLQVIHLAAVFFNEFSRYFYPKRLTVQSGFYSCWLHFMSRLPTTLVSSSAVHLKSQISCIYSISLSRLFWTSLRAWRYLDQFFSAAAGICPKFRRNPLISHA